MVKIQKVIIILSRKVRNNQVCACWKWVFAFVKKCLGQFSSDIFYSSHIRIYQVETEMYFCANFLFKSTLPLKPRCVVWKQYKKYPPTFPFSFSDKTAAKKRKNGNPKDWNMANVPFLWPFWSHYWQWHVLGRTVVS